MTWNNRVVKKKQKIGRSTYTSYGIHEVFYNKKGEPMSCTVDPVEVHGENEKELMLSFLLMAEAFNKPVLDYSTIGKDKENDTKSKRSKVPGDTKKCPSSR